MNLSILICTRNRNHQLDILLKSIVEQSRKPHQVVVVSSGDSVDQTIDTYKNCLNLNHMHLELPGQIRQKISGIKLLDRDCDWVLFLDDDVKLKRNTIENLIEAINEFANSDQSVIGVGLKIPSTSSLNGRSKFMKIIARIFALHSDSPGDILSSGHPVSYTQELSKLQTNWLNGISAWKLQNAQKYSSDFLESKYSAYEDVFFSYSQSKIGRLVFLPEISIEFQNESVTDTSNYEIFESASYWRLKFVIENREFSEIRFFLSHIIRCIFFLVKRRRNLRDTIREFLKVLALTCEILLQLIVIRNPNLSLDRHCRY
jgi:glycosyltransferase involved in cell wall biosynthesis